MIKKTITRLFPHNTKFTQRKLLKYLKTQVKRHGRIHSAHSKRQYRTQYGRNEYSEGNLGNLKKGILGLGAVRKEIETKRINKGILKGKTRNMDLYMREIFSAREPHEVIKERKLTIRGKRKQLKSSRSRKSRISKNIKETLSKCLKDKTLAKHYKKTKDTINSIPF